MKTRTLAAALAVLMLAAPTMMVMAHEDDPEPVGPQDLAERFSPRPAGVERNMTFFYGPFTIPPGQDNNRVTADIPMQGGFLTDVQANVYDAETGARPSNQDMHIHHAHWFRASEDPDEDYYINDPTGNTGIAWVFGTGEERTRGNLNGRSAQEPAGGPSYGIYIEPGQPQALIYMLHNKNAAAQNVYVALDVTFVYGSADDIAAAPAGCTDLLFSLEEGETCRAGEDFHHLDGTLWGSTWDVPRNFAAWNAGLPSTHVRGPTGTVTDSRSSGLRFTAGYDGTSIGTAGHLHPNGLATIVVNQGSVAQPCGDLDNDGYPGITIARSHKLEQVSTVFPHSEEYQMGATKDGWRAPIRAGDRILQYGVYADDRYASYEAMTFAGIYVDRQQPPEPRGPEGCTLANTGAYLIGDDASGPMTLGNWDTITDTGPNDDWGGRVSHGHCGATDDPGTEDDESKPCDDASKLVPGPGTGKPAPDNTVHIANFLNVPGDMSLADSPGDLGAPALITKGDVLRFVNEDTAIGVRHTITSCEMPCNGQYVANYPQPDGYFDSDKMGNLDYIDGGVVGESASPVWDLETEDLDAGLYSYYCRIHPWMRGWVEVAEA